MPKSWISRGAEAAERQRQLIRFRGFAPGNRRLWTEEHDNILRDLFPDYRAAMKKLQRSYSAVKWRAAVLGLVTKKHIWTARDISQLRRIYPRATNEELLAAFPGHELRHIRSIASFYRIRRAKRPLVRTGDALLDAVRDRACELNYNMSDLDALAHSGKYFTKASWKGCSVNILFIQRAVKAMGGQLAVAWEE